MGERGRRGEGGSEWGEKEKWKRRGCKGAQSFIPNLNISAAISVGPSDTLDAFLAFVDSLDFIHGCKCCYFTAGAMSGSCRDGKR